MNLSAKDRFAGDQKINYIYDAAGIKMQKRVYHATSHTVPIKITSYAGNYIYEKESTTESLQFFSYPEGYVEKNGSSFDYVYQYKDHLKNVRLSYSDSNNDGSIDAATEIISEKNYYPFGLTHKGYNNVISGNSNAAADKFGFGGKELQDELGLEWMDFHARNYDASLGRWMNVDPLAEKFVAWSPYVYVHNNPINMTDPTGMEAEWVPDQNGNLIAQAGDNAASLAKHLNISESKASNMINSQNLTRDNYVESDPSVTKDQTLIVDNIMTRGTDSETDTSDKTSYQYNCHDCSKAVVTGEELSSSMTSRGAPSLADPIFTTRKDKNYKESTTEVTANEAVFGQTVITIGTLHSVVYYGKSQDGTVYAFTKEGHSSFVKPRVEKLSDIYNRHNATTKGDEKIRYFNHNSN
ncbi:RHS repeat-associated core domain-containing protein [Nonlabens sp. Ci31]|uniref:RHS repeat domain-containing protein n=1 Tax=Nonlabens sp. Ci31 TaxID=2608253 RepID=UPI0014633BDE|nr:RHS repeat-associated core domain-containing protein [Nonlabens sp. Ci31]QJP35152.1 RHS repeat-associated core domain-containing protein [Nonlabens sp. Ci31]